MTVKTKPTNRINRKLLSPKFITQCNEIALNDSGLFGKRAAALLLLNEGLSQAQAAEKSGLTAGQVKYLAYSFRNKGMAIFPQGSTVSEKEVIKTSSKEMVEPEKEEKKSKGGKKKKGKETKKKKREKAAKKDSKKKKDSKSKKGKKVKSGKKKKSKKTKRKSKK